MDPKNWTENFKKIDIISPIKTEEKNERKSNKKNL
jgi:hypothetical protein